MAKKKALPTKTCEDCVHEYACKCWTTGRVLSPENASRCSAFETVKDTAGYLIGKMDGQKAAQPKWISVEERLPQENEYVLIFADSVQVARFIKGITEEERALMRNGEIENPPVSCWDSERGMCSIPRSELYGPPDVFGNNTVPYYWKANGGPMSWFGQEVTHWMPLPEPPKEEES